MVGKVNILKYNKELVNGTSGHLKHPCTHLIDIRAYAHEQYKYCARINKSIEQQQSKCRNWYMRIITVKDKLN